MGQAGLILAPPERYQCTGLEPRPLLHYAGGQVFKAGQAHAGKRQHWHFGGAPWTRQKLNSPDRLAPRT